MKAGSPEHIRRKFLSLAEQDALDLCRIAKFVKSNCNSTVPLMKPKNCTLRICGQDGTVYAGNEDQLEAWKDFYLPERMEMEVIGAIDDFPCEAFGLQLVLLLCEDGKVYAYEDEVLHLVSMNLRDLFHSKMVFPGIQTFRLGECFEDLTEEEHSEMMECDEIKEMRESQMKFRETLELELLNTINDIRQTSNDHVDINKQKHSEETTSSTERKIQDSSLPYSCKMEKRDSLTPSRSGAPGQSILWLVPA